MSFHYFLVGVKPTDGRITAEDFAAFGLDQSLSDLIDADKREYSAFEMSIAGKTGTFLTPNVAPGVSPETVTYKPESQSWLQLAIGENELFIGWTTARPPVPTELLRPVNYSGYSIDDCSNRKWTTPVARSVRGNVTLPSDFEFDFISGDATEVLSDDFDRLWNISGELYKHWNEEGFELDATTIAQYALFAIGVNYRVGPVEFAAFKSMGAKIFDSAKASAFCLAVIDLQILDDYKKKLEQEISQAPENPESSSSTSASGNADSGRATAPVASK